MSGFSRFKTACVAAAIALTSLPAFGDVLNDEFENLSRLLPEQAGRGKTDYPVAGDADVPKSYAFFLSADLRFRSGVPSEKARQAGRWLLENRFGTDKQTIGWGLPFPWDAFGNGTVNEGGTLYTISTAVVIGSLLDWLEMDKNAPRAEIIDAVSKAFRPYLDKQNTSTGGIPAYSLSPFDREVDVFNPAAFLAGQAQRFSRLVDEGQAKPLQDLADRVIRFLLDYRREDLFHGWYWNYSVTEFVPNDLPHASYIITGIRAYVQHGGRLAGDVDLDAVMRHLNSFTIPESGRWLAWPAVRGDGLMDPPRLYDLGLALSLLEAEDPRAQSLVALSRFYRIQTGHYVVRPNELRVINEYETTWLFGLGTFLNRQAKIRVAVERGTPTTQRGSRVVVPFVKFEHRAVHYRLSLDTSWVTSRLVDGSGSFIELPRGMVPLKVLDLGRPAKFIVARQAFTSRIKFLVALGPGAIKSLQADELEGMLFRQAAVHGPDIVLVLYDPVKLVNVVHRFRIGKNRSQPVLDQNFQAPLALRDPLGYEHQPRILALEGEKELVLAAGAAVSRYTGDDVKTAYLPEGSRILEMVASGPSIFALVHRGGGAALPYSVFELNSAKELYQVDGDGVPYGLRIENGREVLSYARKAADYVAMMRRDFEVAASSGVMSLGIDNAEGEVVWSQSYFLSGMLDFLTKIAPRFSGDAVDAFVADVSDRLDAELALVDQLLRTPQGLQSRLFSVGRVPETFAVQTGKMLLLLKRVRNETKLGGLTAETLKKFAESTVKLTNHMETLATSRGSIDGLAMGRAYLRWDHGKPFKYDGTGVPYNHQNCWAAGVLLEGDGPKLDERTREAAIQISRQVLDEEGFVGNNPRHMRPSWLAPKPELYYSWYYWWGPAKAGWTKETGISANTPEWKGDGDNIAMARYRTFDAIAALVSGTKQPDVVDHGLLLYFDEAVERGGLEPFLTPYLMKYGLAPKMTRKVALQYARADSQPDFRNTFWSMYALAEN